MLHQAVRDAALGGREPDAVEQVEHPVGGCGDGSVIHGVTVCMKTFRRNRRPFGHTRPTVGRPLGRRPWWGGVRPELPAAAALATFLYYPHGG
ncbi:hypothetical protein GCM10027259_07160 [Micromonospora palomenae]